MQGKKIKSVQISLEYRSYYDLAKLFEQIKRELRAGEKQVSSSVKGCRYRMDVLEDIPPVIKVEVKSRIEIINGDICEVIPSKMNYE